ncbi:MAG: hypothetical protein E7507_06180 [Ruminococcus sp.]|nr:hypothetical protein [Ruminococcus sp.]
MKNALGLIIFGLIAAGIGAAATVFALKKKDELEKYEDYDDEMFFDDCDCNCEECAGCEDITDEDFSDLDLDDAAEAVEDLEKLDGADDSSDF